MNDKHGLFNQITDKHMCDDDTCLLGGLTRMEIGHLGYALNVVEEHPERIESVVFRDDSGTYALLTYTDDDGATAVIGTVLVPGLFDIIAPYIRRASDGEVN